MGFLEAGLPLPWEDSLEVAEYVRKHGILQFLHLYNSVKDIANDELLWGDEVEYSVLKLAPDGSDVKLSLCGAELLQRLRDKEPASDSQCGEKGGESVHWAPEWGSWMVEGTPGGPYCGFAADLLKVEKNMRSRRARLLAALGHNEICPTVPCFPMMGVGEFTSPAAEPGGDKSLSLFVPDEIINPHPRFGTLVQNIRKRRGSKVDIRMPRYHDSKTPAGTPVGCPAPATLQEALAMDEVYMDAMAFGMGCCCLQVTFQGRDVTESRHLYDQLAVLSPMLLALTAATPIARGALLDTDVRWDIIAQSVDDRTPAERGIATDEACGPCGHPAMAGGGVRPLPKSRYASISRYICNHNGGKYDDSKSDLYNDINAPIDDEAYRTLLEGGVDEVLARHVAHLFVRDPLVIFKERVEIEDKERTDHFENIQSTNWQTVRWKPPPAGTPLTGSKHIGWRTEFRSMEVQLTDFENAAFTVFIVLVSRVLLYFNLNLYLPISKVDENMARAHNRDAVNNQKFWFRVSALPDRPDGKSGWRPGETGRWTAHGVVNRSNCCGDLPFQECTLAEILTGKGEYRGLIPTIMAYLDMIDTDSVTMESISTYMQFICARANGELMTPATWMRNFVLKHPDYNQDSVISPKIAADLMSACHRIGTGELKVPELHGSFAIAPVLAKDAYAKSLRRESSFSRYSRTNAYDIVAMHQLRLELLAKKRTLQAQEQEYRIEMEKLQAELRNIDSQLAMMSAS